MIETLAEFIRDTFHRAHNEPNYLLAQKAMDAIKEVRNRRADLRKVQLDLRNIKLEYIHLNDAH